MIAYRYGAALPDDDAGRDDLAVLISYVVRINADPLGAAVKEARWLAPWLSEDEARDMADVAMRRPVMDRADAIAERLGVTFAERTDLGLTTIGCIDLSREERNAATRARRAERERERRRKAGAVKREEYLAKALTRTRPWEAEGISRRAWYKRRARGAQVRAHPDQGTPTNGAQVRGEQYNIRATDLCTGTATTPSNNKTHTPARKRPPAGQAPAPRIGADITVALNHALHRYMANTSAPKKYRLADKWLRHHDPERIVTAIKQAYRNCGAAGAEVAEVEALLAKP